MIKTYFIVNSNGYITEKYVLNEETEELKENYIEKWEGEFILPRFNKRTQRWEESAEPWEILGYDTLEEYKSGKKKELEEICELRILSGFDFDLKNKTYQISYDKESQLNFQETYQLFQNNILTAITWTASINGEKVRIVLDGKEFHELYYKSVKHKLESISRLRDVLIPLLDEAIAFNQMESINWNSATGDETVSELLTEKTLGKQVGTLSTNMSAQKMINREMEDIILEVADIAMEKL